MAAEFDPFDRTSWDFGKIGREDANALLAGQDDGVFLLRESNSLAGEYVLSVSESSRDNGVSHYRISPQDGRFTIGDREFTDLPSLLSHYKLHVLETTCLLRPVERHCEKFIARYDFVAQDANTDLPFRRSEILYVIEKGRTPDDLWWKARNESGQEGQIPANYVEPYTEETAKHRLSGGQAPLPPAQSSGSSPSAASDTANNNMCDRPLPAKAKVVKARIPSVYDKSALRLTVGDIILVTKTNATGTWEGILDKKTGRFPFTCVEWVDSGPSSPHASIPNGHSNH